MDFDQVTVNGVNSNFILFTKYCFVVFLEFLDSSVCQRMFCHLFKNFVWNCCDVCTSKSTLCYMDWMI